MDKKVLFLLLSLSLSLSFSEVYALPWDTGYVTFMQPNGITFTARSWGDEYFWYMETNSGYRFVDSPDGWYYYAVLNSEGEFTASTSKVGIDKPLPTSLNLDRSLSRITELNSEREQSNYHNYTKYQNIIQNSPMTGSISLGIVLIDFPTSRRNLMNNNGAGYLYSEFVNLFFSTGSYFSVKDRAGNLTTPHPDGEEVFGSLKDYINDQTRSNINLIGENSNPELINNLNVINGTPDWMILSHEITWYDSAYGSGVPRSTFLNDLLSEIKSYYGENIIDSFSVIGIVFGGARQISGKFNSYSIGNTFIIPEMELNVNTNETFLTHTGWVAHEFGHAAFGFDDLYDGQTSPDYWCVMAKGEHNGPSANNVSGACPAPINPYYLYKMGWIDFIDINTNSYNFAIQGGNYYKVSIPYGNNTQNKEFFILHDKESDGFSRYTPDESYYDQSGINIWHATPGGMANPNDDVHLEFSHNNALACFPADGIEQDFNNYTAPSSKTFYPIKNSSISINNITLNGVGTNQWVEVDVIDDVPIVPNNFSVIGSIGQNPQLSWDINPETDIINYRIYRKLGNDVEMLLTELDYSINTYVDNEITVSGGKFDPTVCYKISSVDTKSQESPKTLPECKSFNQIQKESKLELDNNESFTFNLYDPYPNPFNPQTTVTFSIAYDSNVNISVYDILGSNIKVLVNRFMQSGKHSINFNASLFPSGIYYIVMESGSRIFTKRINLVK